MFNSVKVFLLLFVCVTLHFSQEVSSEIQMSNLSSEPVSEVKVLYFSDYIETVYNKLPEIQLNRLKLLENQVKLVNAQKNKEWLWELRSGLFRENEFSGDLENPFIFQSGWELNSSLNKTFYSIGGRMNLDFTFRSFVAESVGSDPIIQEFFIPSLTLGYAQPLLKNAFGVLDRLPSTLTSLDAKITEWGVEEENAYILATYKKLYMQWVVYSQVHEFLLESLRNAESLNAVAQKQLNIGYIDNADFQNTKLLIFRIKNDLMDVRKSYTNLKQQISFIIDDTNIEPDSNEWDVLRQAVDNESFQSIPFEDTRQFVILEFMHQKLKYSAGALVNSKLPELNLLLSASLNMYSTNSGSTVRDDWLIIPAFYAGMQLRYPFGDMSYKSQKIEHRKFQMEYDILSQKYRKDFLQSQEEKQHGLQYYKDKLFLYENIAEAYNQRYKAQYRNFERGRESLGALIDTKNAILQNYSASADIQLRLIFEYFDFLVLNNKDEVSLQMY